MVGQAPFAKDDTGAINRAYLLNNKNQWEPAKNPLNRYSTIKKKFAIQKMNPGYTFAKTMLEKDRNISIGLVSNARGSTEIDEWKRGSKCYSEAVRRTKKAQETGILKGILWHQGEGDFLNPETYLVKLSELIANLRKDLAEPNLLFVAGEILYHAKGLSHDQNPINQQIAMLPNTVPFSGVVNAKGLKLLDRAHFDTKSMKLLGERYAEEMIKLQTKIKAEQRNALD
jgi:hypothetical protein